MARLIWTPYYCRTFSLKIQNLLLEEMIEWILFYVNKDCLLSRDFRYTPGTILHFNEELFSVYLCQSTNDSENVISL